MWPRKGLIKVATTERNSQGIEGYGGVSLWRRRPALSCSANQKEEINKQLNDIYSVIIV